MRKLNRLDEAARLEESFKSAVAVEMEKTPSIDEFSKFGEEGTNGERVAVSYFMQGLVAKLAADDAKTKESFDAALKLNPSLIWARATR